MKVARYELSRRR